MTDSPAEAAKLGIYLYCLARPECLALVQGLAEQALHGVDERYPVTTLALTVRVDVRPGASPGTLSKPTLAVLTMVVPSTMPSPTSA